MEATLQSIFRTTFDDYRARHGLSMDQHKAAQAIMSCRSEALGYEEWACPNDDHVERQPHSCRHRSCPRCQGARSHEWLEQIKERLLPVNHYHVVFTLPHELNPIWHYNRRWCADRLFKASAETLRQLLKDDRYLGAEPGLLSSLHTWGRTLIFHPHVHVLITGGGVAEGEYREVQKDFLLPVGVLKAKFRGKWLSWLNQAYDAGELRLPEHWTEADWRKTLRRVARKPWNVRIQGAYRHGQGVAVYLSRYIRGGPIKDHRLLSADHAQVRFRYRDHHDGKEKTLALQTDQFLSRVLWHVPSDGQHHVRYYGLYTPGGKAKRAEVWDQLGEVPKHPGPEAEPQVRQCPVCGGVLVHRCSVRREISSIRSARVQQHAQADRERPAWDEGRHPFHPPSFFLGRAAAP